MIYAVVQFGGSSGEHYVHSFVEKHDADAYVRETERSSYHCIGPFEIQLPAESNLASVAAKTVQWLNSIGFRDDPHTLELKHATAEVKTIAQPR